MTVMTTLHVIVHYVAAGKPFQDKDAPLTETVGELKQAALTFFDLTEGTLPDGSTTTYTLYKDKQPLTDLSQSLGDLAGDKRELQLKLSQQIVQGK